MRRFPLAMIQSGFLFATVLMLIECSSCIATQAATIRIVALGASNTVGRGGGSYPAELQALLAAKGYSVEVINAGVNGDTTADMLARLDSAVPDGTRLVLVSPATPNDRKAGILGRQGAYVAQIVSRLRARGIKAIVLPRLSSLARRSDSDPEHYSHEGYGTIAAKLLPRVMAALGPPGR
jgi:acyl-CoA thioesterase-1